ncbi:hypothetical protein BDR07DRAFT_1444706 [Suillus spraguei]|nr:hypothetical protein BDR07DRAFT_1444706 [Suillus spraguei]
MSAAGWKMKVEKYPLISLPSLRKNEKSRDVESVGQSKALANVASRRAMGIERTQVLSLRCPRRERRP